MTEIKKTITSIFKNKIPKTATHFFHEGGYISFLNKTTRFKKKIISQREYEDLMKTNIAPFQLHSLID